MPWIKTKISEFLTERTNRLKPDEANQLGLSRIEKIDFSGTIHLNNNKLTKTGMILVKDGDLIVSGINVEKGALAIYHGDDALATIHYSSYIYDDSKIDIEYLKWYLKSSVFKSIVKEQVKGGIKTEIKAKTFLNLEIMLPDLPIQKEIANELNNVKNNINNLEKFNSLNVELVKQLRQSILQKAIQGKLVPQDPNDEPACELLKRIKVEKEQLIKDGKLKREKSILPITQEELPFEIPDNWEWIKIQDIALKVTDGEHITPQRTSNGYYLLSARNITNEGLKLDDVDYVGEDEYNRIRKRCNPDKNDILISCSGSIGRVCLVDKNDAYVMVRSAAMIKLFKDLFSDFIKYVLRSDCLQKQMVASSKMTAQANLFIGKITNLIIPLPPIEEQKRIVAKVDELLKLCDELEKQNEEAQKSSSELLQSIMQKYFRSEA